LEHVHSSPLSVDKAVGAWLGFSSFSVSGVYLLFQLYLYLRIFMVWLNSFGDVLVIFVAIQPGLALFFFFFFFFLLYFVV
jgi:hypothetical protein